MSADLSLDQLLAIEGAAAQLYERTREGIHASHFWPALNSNVKTKWRDTARRKLKTGEIAGWPK